MKKIISMIVILMFIIIPIKVKGIAHVHSHVHVHSSSHTTHSTSHSSTPKTTIKSYRGTVKSGTGKTYNTTKSKTSSRITVKHDIVKPKNNTNKNTNLSYYKNYNENTYYSANNSIFRYYMLTHLIKNNNTVQEKNIVKALEEKGYSEEEAKQILDEAKAEEKANKKFYDGWKWYNWILLILIIIIPIILLIVFI